jgi:HPt (histidine-containing phosphotransfer) domain-containing protein
MDRARRTLETAPPPLLDETPLAELEALGGQWLVSILELFAGESRKDAAELMAAAGGGDMPLLKSVAHRLKGACRAVGAVRVAGLSADLESMASAGYVRTSHAVLGDLAAALEETNEAFRARIAEASTAPTESPQ